MRRTQTTIAATLVATLVLVATACYPPSQTATTQPIPPGGRVVAVGPVLTTMQIEDALPDLSEILYQETDFLLTTNGVPQRFWVYDDHTGLTKQVPVGADVLGSAALSPDGRQVVFSSEDLRLQVGPTAVNCGLSNFPNPVNSPAVCTELYLFDLDTGQVRQLTGLDGSSSVFHNDPTFTADGQSIDFTTTTVAYSHTPSFGYEQLDPATGQITDLAPPSTSPTTSWDRGTHTVTWDSGAASLTSTDATTGAVTSLWSNTASWFLASATDNGRLIVLGDWVTGQEEIFRLIDTDTGTVRTVSTEWISQDGTRYAVAQQNVSPDATDRLIIAPLPPA